MSEPLPSQNSISPNNIFGSLGWELGFCSKNLSNLGQLASQSFQSDKVSHQEVLLIKCTQGNFGKELTLMNCYGYLV